VEGCSVTNPSAEATSTQSVDQISPTKTATIATEVSSRTHTTPPLIGTQLPTLLPEDAYTQLQDLLEENSGCRLPCWWGITPGKTTWKDAESYLGTFNNLGDARGSEQFFALDVHLRLPKEKGTLSHTYYIKNDVVVGINAYVFDWSSFLYLSNFLAEYGPPDEVFLKTFRYEENGMRPYQVDLFYAKLGMLLEYSGGDVNNIGDKLQNCFEDMYSPFVFIWSTDEPLTSGEAINKYLLQQPMPYPIPLKIATGVDVTTFYELFKNPDSKTCLETPAELWPEP
jgi:hypothetical protein